MQKRQCWRQSTTTNKYTDATTKHPITTTTQPTNHQQQNTKHNWDAPHEFRPERWLDVPVETYVYNAKAGAGSAAAAAAAGATSRLAAAAAASKEGITFMPFSDGPRSCVGQSLAKMEVLTLLAKILGSFTIELAPEMGGLEGVLARESTQLTLQTKGTKGIRMRMTPRSEHVAAGVVCAGAVSE